MARNRKGQGVERPDSPAVVEGEVRRHLAATAEADLEAKSQAYIEGSCVCCPNCDDSDITVDDGIEPDGSMFAYRSLSCNNCGSTWQERLCVEKILNLEVKNDHES